ncbi:hypothetical protein D3C86_1329890 [compost metagenome]
MVIVLSQIAERLGLDLGEAIDRKMAINRSRKWVTAGDGTGQHVEEGVRGDIRPWLAPQFQRIDALPPGDPRKGQVF